MQQDNIEDANVVSLTRLQTPRQLKESLPLEGAAAYTVRQARAELRDILHGHDQHRIAVVVGPCSIHDVEAALEYAEKLRCAAEPLRDQLLVVMRTYFEKPRTTVGWKGLVNDPDLDGSCDMGRGVALARRLLLDVNAMGLPCGTELLDPIAPQYFGDAVSWAAVGARTTESQTHREMASGLSMPVGFKNGMDGGLDVALQAMISSAHPHSFLGIDEDGAAAVVRTRGNSDRHVVLRGGSTGTNFSEAHVVGAADALEDQGVARPVMVDCSHGNSSKDHRRQSAVAREVVSNFQSGERRLMGVMLESNLGEGRQNWTSGKLQRGVSITDACIGWEETAELLEDLAASVQRYDLRKACA